MKLDAVVAFIRVAEIKRNPHTEFGGPCSTTSDVVDLVDHHVAAVAAATFDIAATGGSLGDWGDDFDELRADGPQCVLQPEDLHSRIGVTNLETENCPEIGGCTLEVFSNDGDLAKANPHGCSLPDSGFDDKLNDMNSGSEIVLPHRGKYRPLMVEPDFLRFDTLSLHAGQQPDPTTGARAVPIFATTSYSFPDTDEAAALFNLEAPGHIYSRISNPTVAVLEERLAALEGGVGAVCTASGTAALHLGVASLMSAGDHIVASKNLYGGSYNMMNLTLPRFGITTTFVDPRDPAAFAAAIRPNTKIVYAETLGNPGIEVLDIEAVADVAHAAGLPLMVDSTFSTPYLMRPIEHGADIVMHSVTKFLGGHGVALGGVLVDGGRFDWAQNDKFPTLTEPYAGYHGVVFTDEFGPSALGMRARAEGLRDFGACMSPHNAFTLLQGVETLPLRMARHIDNTDRVLEALQANDAVTWVRHPRVADHPDHELAKRLYPKGAGAILSFGVKGGRSAGRKFIESVRLASHLANVGDAKTLVIHPGSTTHGQLSAEQLEASGISEDLIRFSVGLEDPEDIVEDLERALKASQR